MKIVTSEEMRDIDRRTVEEYGVSGTVLMENAGRSVVDKIKELYGRKRVVVICGSGNNGGDGMVVARDLHNEGWDVKVFLASSPEALKGDALLQYGAASRFGVPLRGIDELLGTPAFAFRSHTLIVDAIFGTGLSKPITGRLSEVITCINRSGMPVVSVDIPSGVSSDNGQVMGCAVKADVTVTFGLPKRGHILYPGAELTGRLFVEDIGFPRELLEKGLFGAELIEKEEAAAMIPRRRNYSNKGDYGHVLIVAGSTGKTGAALMAAKACLRSGAGLVTLGFPESLADIFQSRVTEEMTLALPDTGHGALSGKAYRKILDFADDRADVIAVGPGIGVTEDTSRLVKSLIRNSARPLVIDADGINSIRGDKGLLKNAKSQVILTPHPGEMARLLGGSKRYVGRVGGSSSGKSHSAVAIADIEKDRIGTASSFARETGTVLVLKGVPTVITSPDGISYINSTGNPGMATAGTGDVLTGVVSGLLGRNRDPLQACILGVYLHGLAGDLVSAEKGQHSMIATDIIEKLPAAFLSLKK